MGAGDLVAADSKKKKKGSKKQEDEEGGGGGGPGPEPRKKKPKKGAPGWVTTFADLMSLLMCFFVMLVYWKAQNLKVNYLLDSYTLLQEDQF